MVKQVFPVTLRNQYTIQRIHPTNIINAIKLIFLLHFILQIINNKTILLL